MYQINLSEDIYYHLFNFLNYKYNEILNIRITSKFYLKIINYVLKNIKNNLFVKKTFVQISCFNCNKKYNIHTIINKLQEYPYGIIYTCDNAFCYFNGLKSYVLGINYNKNLKIYCNSVFSEKPENNRLFILRSNKTLSEGIIICDTIVHYNYISKKYDSLLVEWNNLYGDYFRKIIRIKDILKYNNNYKISKKLILNIFNNERI